MLTLPNSAFWLLDPALDSPYQEELFGKYDVGHFSGEYKAAFAKFLSITWDIDAADYDLEVTCYHSMKFGPDVYRSEAYSTYARTLSLFRC